MSYRDRSYSRSRSRSPRGVAREFRPRTNAPDSAPKIFVGNLAYDTQETDFKAHFEHCGRIVEILMPRDPHTNRSKGYGFVTFEDFDSMEKAINKMDHSVLLGNEIKVDRANERKERPKPQDDRRGGGYGGRMGGSYDRGGYDRDRGGSSYDRDRMYDSRASYDRGSSHRSGGYDGTHGGSTAKKPVGFRCRISGLARDVGWQLLKDFLRQAGDVTYANVDPDGLGVGEYQSYAECRDAIDKLTGAALDGHIVKLTALNFDYDTGERLDRPSSRNYDMSGSRSNPYDLNSKSYRSSGANSSGFVQRRDGSRDRGGGSYNNGRAGSAGYSDDRDGGHRGGYDRSRDDNHGPSGVVYSNAHNAPGGSSRYGGGGGSGDYAGGSSKYGGGPDRSGLRSRSVNRQGPYDRPSGSY